MSLFPKVPCLHLLPGLQGPFVQPIFPHDPQGGEMNVEDPLPLTLFSSQTKEGMEVLPSALQTKELQKLTRDDWLSNIAILLY